MKYTLRTFVIAVTLYLTGADVAIAQQQDTIYYKDSTRYYEHAYMGFHYANQDQLTNLNSRLLPYFPQAIPQSLIGLSYGGKSVFGPLLLQGEVGFAGGVNGRRNRGRTSAFHGYLSFDAGLMLTPPGAVRIYPFVGIGGDLLLITYKQDPRQVHFDSLLTNPVVREGMEPVNFSAGFFTWRAGLAVDIGKKGGVDGSSVGLRAGYRQSFHTSRWGFEGDNSYAGTPSDRLRQWFAGIVIYSPAGKMKDRSRR